MQGFKYHRPPLQPIKTIENHDSFNQANMMNYHIMIFIMMNVTLLLDKDRSDSHDDSYSLSRLDPTPTLLHASDGSRV